MLVFIDDITRSTRPKYAHCNAVLFEQIHHLIDFCDMFSRRRFEPTHTLIFAARIARSPKALRFFKVLVEPFSQLVQSDFLITGKPAGFGESGRGVENAHRDLRRSVNCVDGEAKIHGTLPKLLLPKSITSPRCASPASNFPSAIPK
jgi:hypothetical protein